ncbi:MAG: hypothetical protein MK193_09120 [Lentisphaeria bacterium]|nr:hypothetical protein [Lentisphaeria bacterium]
MSESEGRIAEFKGAAKEKFDQATVATKDALCRSGELIREKSKEVDDKVHNNPWPVVGGAFVGGILLGYILGRK